MKKENFMAMAHTKDDKIWIAYLLDRISFAEEKYVSSYTAFLDIREQAIAKRILASFAHLPHLFWGGSPDCERAQLGIAGEYGQILPEDFPLVSFKLTSRELKRLSHRDFLGALMGLGIKREKLGDILLTKEACYFFVCADIAAYIEQNLIKVGSAGVQLTRCQPEQITFKREYREIRATVSSPRIDTITAHLTALARAKAEQLILSGRVQVDHFDVVDKNVQVREGATISIKGYGRYQVDQIGPTTKKGRLVFVARKYV